MISNSHLFSKRMLIPLNGIPWLNIIPENWSIKKFSHTTYIKARIGWQNLRSEEFVKEGPYCVTGTDFENGKIIWDRCYHVTEERFLLDPYIILKEGDLLITKDGTIGKLALVKELQGKATLNSGVFLTRANHDYLNEFMFWVLSSNIFASFIRFMNTGTTINHLYQHMLNRFKYPLPPLSEQTQIARFLDYKTGQIDRLIAKKEELLKLLAEKRTSIITKAVTKGLDPSVEMKDSGIDWLGEIPKHWEIKKIKFISSKVGDGLHGTPEYTENTNYFFINGNNLGNGSIRITPQTKTISEEQYLSNNKKLTYQTLLLSINGTIGNVAFYKGETVMLGKSAAYIKFLNWVNIKYLRWFLESSLFENFYELELTGTTIKNLSLESIKNTPVVFPEKVEQERIVEYLDKKTAKLDEIILKVEKSINQLKEYREALITASVTGQIDVRNEIIEEDNINTP